MLNSHHYRKIFCVCFPLEVRPVVFLKKDETILEVLKNGDKRLVYCCSATCTERRKWW